MPDINQTVTYSAVKYPATATDVSYEWSLPLGGGTVLSPTNTGQNFQVNWTSTGAKQVKVILTNSCTSEVIEKVNNVQVTSGGRVGPETPIVTYPKDVFLSYWLGDPNDWKNCNSINPNYPDCNPVISGQQAIDAGRTVKYNPNAKTIGGETRIKTKARRDLTKPVFYSEYQAEETITNNNGESGLTDYNIKLTQAAYDECLEYCFESGAKGFNIYFYDETDADVAEHIPLNRNSTSQYAPYVKFYYTLGSLGFRANPTIDRIVADMSNSRYYKINNKPVINIDTPEDTKFHVDRWILQSGATFHDDGTEQYWTQNSGYSGPIYIADRNGAAPAANTVPASGETPVMTIYQEISNRYASANGGVTPWMYISGGYFYHDNSGVSGNQATGAYCLPPSDFNVNHSYSNAITFSENQLNSVVANRNVIPTITTGFNNIGITGQQATYVDTPSAGELIDHLNRIKNIIKSGTNASRVPFVNVYSFGETTEAGGGALVPRKNPDGSIDKSMITAVRTALTN